MYTAEPGQVLSCILNVHVLQKEELLCFVVNDAYTERAGCVFALYGLHMARYDPAETNKAFPLNQTAHDSEPTTPFVSKGLERIYNEFIWTEIAVLWP